MALYKPQGARFVCPSCEESVVDRWVSRLHKGSVIKCPQCKTAYRLLKEPGEKTPGEYLEKIVMSFEDKLKAFNLLPITKNMVFFLEENYPEMPKNFDSFDYVKFHQSHPYFYSKWFIEDTMINDLLKGFRLMTCSMPELSSNND